MKKIFILSAILMMVGCSTQKDVCIVEYYNQGSVKYVPIEC